MVFKILTFLSTCQYWIGFFSYSLFAATCGAKNVFAFEVSQTLCEIATSFTSASKFGSSICILDKMSTDHVISEVDKMYAWTWYGIYATQYAQNLSY